VPIKLALPKGRLLRKTASLLQKAGWGIDEYHSRTGFYRPRSRKFPDVLLRVFHEKDIPVQIAMGNYDLGICCLDWIEELLVKYPGSDILRIKDLTYGEGALYMASVYTPDELRRNGHPVRIVSEYPNLAESFALKRRLGCRRGLSTGKCGYGAAGRRARRGAARLRHRLHEQDTRFQRIPHR
jgi:ATP phosphoribosyltransferase